MNTSTCPRIVIIGAGISGLLSALALSKEGHAVTVLEREPEVGGVCRSYRVGPYKVDTGPHIITRLQDGPLRTLIDDYFETAPVFVLRPVRPSSQDGPYRAYPGHHVGLLAAGARPPQRRHPRA
jgi:phytoene dehydrogenase-like protein